MELNRIGTTGVSVTKVAFGCSAIGNLYREVDENEAFEVLECAWRRGIRYFDTAPHYGRGLSEQRLGKFLRGRQRSAYAVSTKIGRLLAPGPELAEADGFVKPLPMSVRYDYTGDGIEASFEQSCDRLGTAYIDIVYVHDIGCVTHGAEATRHMNDLLGSGFARLRKLKAAGRIGAFGLGVNENEVCLQVLKETSIDVILLAGRLTLLDRSAEAELVRVCENRSVSLVLGGVFNSGILAKGPEEGALFDYEPASVDILEKVRRLDRRAAEFGVPLAAAALRFAVTHPAAASVLIGTAQTRSLERNLDALAAPWSPEADAALESVWR